MGVLLCKIKSPNRERIIERCIGFSLSYMLTILYGLSRKEYIAVADEKYFYHYFISPCFAPECPVLQGISGICEMCVLADILAKYGKMEQVVAGC